MQNIPDLEQKQITWRLTLNILSKHLKSSYYSTAQTCPLGIKMWLIPKLRTVVNSNAYAKVAQLTNHQACFWTTPRQVGYKEPSPTLATQTKCIKLSGLWHYPLVWQITQTNHCSMPLAPWLPMTGTWSNIYCNLAPRLRKSLLNSQIGFWNDP